MTMDLEEYESLSPEEQAKVFRESLIREKGALLLRAHEPDRMVRALSEEELYLILKEMDLEERSEILRHATLPQLFFVSDIECWSRDRLNPEGFVRWLETLRSADDGRLFAWLLQGDYEMIVTGLKKVIQVHKVEREYAMDEILGDTPYFTLDENYFIAVREQDFETVRRAFEVLFENHRGRYVALLEGVIAEIEEQTEEEAYRVRERRLAEMGFPDAESAHKIYRPLTRGEFESFPRKDPRSDAPASSAPTFGSENFRTGVPNYLTLWSKGRLFLDDALLHLSQEHPEHLEAVQEELAWLANKVIAADGIDFSSEERVRRGVERARSYVNLGLELLAGHDLSRASGLLTERWLETIFRWGMTPVLELRDRVQSLVRAYWEGRSAYLLNFLDPPYEFIFQGLHLPVPEFHDPGIQGEAAALRDFQTPQDLERTRQAVSQVEALHAVLDRKLRGFFSDFRERDPRSDAFRPMNAVLSQLFILFTVSGDFRYRPLVKNEFKEFLKKGLVKKEEFLGLLFTPEEKDLLRPLWSLAFEWLREEAERLKPETFQPKYLTKFEWAG